MKLTPHSREELIEVLASNYSRGDKIEAVDCGALNALIEHHPEDMTATVEAGITLAAFQEVVRASGQWLPIDPPGATQMTIGHLLALDASGSRRLGYGTIRDYLIGIKVALPDGTVIKAGGKVVKNVAGYDLCKLFVGARHTLGIILEGTFKLRPLPESEKFMGSVVSSLEEVELLRQKLLSTRAEPVLFDACPMGQTIRVVASFAGSLEDVEAQLEIARDIGLSLIQAPDYAEEFWRRDANKASVLPSRTVATLKEIRAEEWFAHLGNGILYYRGGTLLEQPLPLGAVHARVKTTFDPKEIFPPFQP